MAIVVTELYDSREYSRSGNAHTLIRKFQVTGLDEPFDAASAAGVPAYGAYYVPASGPTLMRVKDKKSRVLKVEEEKRCEVTVTYTRDPQDDDETGAQHRDGWDLEVSTQMLHTTAVKNEAYQRHFPDTEDIGTAIGLNGDEVEGVDVHVPKATVSFRTWRRLSEVDQNLKDTIYDLVGKVNEAPFEGWELWELLYLGARISYTEPDPDAADVLDPWVQLEHVFLGEKNQDALEFELIDGAIEVVDKKGWEYLWLRYGSRTDEVAGEAKKVQGIKSVHVAHVYEGGDFTQLPYKKA